MVVLIVFELFEQLLKSFELFVEGRLLVKTNNY